MLRHNLKSYLIQERGHWPKIAEATGISADWMSKFIRGERPDPRVSKFEAILQYAISQGWSFDPKNIERQAENAPNNTRH